MEIDLDLQRAASGVVLPDRQKFLQWIRQALAGAESAIAAGADRASAAVLPRQGVQLTVRIVETDESRMLNETYRHKSGPTNVLSFPFEAGELLDPPCIGDIVICAALVEQEAQQQHKSVESHWAHLVVHGVLHLLGFDHEEDRQAQAMERLEIVVMTGLGYASPYADQVA
ncbi:MAG: rRNA maturation RNase YbeY [Gammaproteobacteria bacterium]|nr:rRNA maturation RNase YbeY [Gammaproteobacteria bacterium]